MQKVLFKTENKVLVITYAFPPTGGIGVARNVKFIKYLSRLGWDISVCTTNTTNNSRLDKTLIKEIPSTVKIYRTDYIDPLLWSKNRWWQSFWQYAIYRRLLFPDREVLWQKSAIKQAKEIIKKEKIDLIFTSSAAISNHFVAYKLKQELGVKWVADFRDEWFSNPELHFVTKRHKKLAKIWEKKIVNLADHVTTVSEPMTEYFQKLVDDSEKVSTITNGFDPEDFGLSQYVKIDECHMVFTGTLYGNGKSNIFDEAVAELNLPHLKIDYYGTGVAGDFLPHNEAIKKMQLADVLLIISSPQPRPVVYSGKIFEYLAARRPILALTPPGNMLEKLIHELKVGQTVEPLDKEGIKKLIQYFYDKWQNNQLNIPQVNLDRFNREKLTQKLAEIFNNLSKTLRLDSGQEKSLKICLVANTVSPQNEKLVRYLLDQGHEIHFISLDEKEISGAINYHIKQKKLVNKFLPWYLFQGFLNKRQALVELQALIAKIKPDVVHGHGVNFAGILAYYSGFEPVVVTTRGSDIMKIRKKPMFEQYLIKQTLKNASIVTGSSLALRDQALKLGTPKANWRDVFFGIDLDVFKPVDTEKLKNDLKITSEKVIFCPRTVAPIYNTDILIQALAAIEEENWKLILLKYRADASYLIKIQALIKELNLVDHVIWLESADAVKMNQLNNLADVVVSLAQSDGAAVSFLEAMASQAKIVISAVGFVKEWQDGKFWVVPIGDIIETKKAIDRALKISKFDFATDGSKNRQLIANRAEIKTNFAKFEKIYNSFYE